MGGARRFFRNVGSTQKPRNSHVSKSRWASQRNIIVTTLSIDMITSFAVDYMHCVCHGVIRKLLWLWIRDPLSTRIGRQNIERISAALAMIENFIPLDFARMPRFLAELSRWTATELRQFLLHTAPA